MSFKDLSRNVSITESDLLLAVVRISSTFKEAWAFGNYKVNGAPFNSDYNDTAVFFSNNGVPNYDFTNKTITFPNIGFLRTKTGTHRITETTDLIIEMPTDDGSYGLYFDNHTKTIFTKTVSVISTIPNINKTDSLIAILRIGGVDNVWTYGAHKVNGLLYNIKPTINGGGKWLDKKANFLGDSIMEAGLYDVIGNHLGLSVIRDYAVGGTGIVGGSVNQEGNHFIDRYTNMSEDADLIVVYGGIVNDYALDTSTPFGSIDDISRNTFCGGFYELMVGIINLHPTKTVVYVSSIHKTSDDVPNENTGKTLSEYRDATQKICDKLGIPFINGFSLGLNPNISKHREELFSDVTHPNTLGTSILGKNIASRLNYI